MSGLEYIEHYIDFSELHNGIVIISEIVLMGVVHVEILRIKCTDTKKFTLIKFTIVCMSERERGRID